MILVTLGTQAFPFDRLLREVDGFPDDEIVVQCASGGMRPERAIWHDKLSFDELVALVSRSRAVVSHAGVGSVLTALDHGRRPVVVPRLRQFGEAVDDHQVEFARRLAKASLVTLVEDPSELPSVLAETQPRSSLRLAPTRLALDLRDYLKQIVDVSHSR